MRREHRTRVEAPADGDTVVMAGDGYSITSGLTINKRISIEPTPLPTTVPYSLGLSRLGKAGSNSFKFSGRLGRRKLRPGKYRLVAVATAGKSKSLPTRAPFKIVR